LHYIQSQMNLANTITGFLMSILIIPYKHISFPAGVFPTHVLQALPSVFPDAKSVRNHSWVVVTVTRISQYTQIAKLSRPFGLQWETVFVQAHTSVQPTPLSVIGNTHKEYLPNIKCSVVDCIIVKDNLQIQTARDTHVVCAV
jgi:hypothetical protein